MKKLEEERQRKLTEVAELEKQKQKIEATRTVKLPSGVTMTDVEINELATKSPQELAKLFTETVSATQKWQEETEARNQAQLKAVREKTEKEAEENTRKLLSSFAKTPTGEREGKTLEETMLARLKNMPLDRLMEENKATAIMQSASAELFQENESLRREVEQFRGGKGFIPQQQQQQVAKRPATEELQDHNKRQALAQSTAAVAPNETIMKIRQNLAWYQQQEEESSSRSFWTRPVIPPQAFGSRFETTTAQPPVMSTSPAQAAVNNNAAAAQSKVEQPVFTYEQQLENSTALMNDMITKRMQSGVPRDPHFRLDTVEYERKK